MTTNQTIDGVPRELLERMVDCAESYVDIDDADLSTLRALLDAPACKTCNGTRLVSEGALHCSSGGIPFENGPIDCVKDCPDCKSAAQPRGEPLIHITPEVLAMLRGERKMMAGGLTYSQSKPVGNWTVPLYAEQPATVAPASINHDACVQEYPMKELVALPNDSDTTIPFIGLMPKGSTKVRYGKTVGCPNCADSKTTILGQDAFGVLKGPCPYCLQKPPPAGSDRISMEGAMIFCGGAPNPITYTGNGAIVNLDGYVLYAPGAEPVAVVMPDLWQPIETAPKDGTEIILRKGDRVTSGAWTDWSKAEAEFHGSTGAYLGQVEYDSGSLWASWDGGFCDDDHPTHWQPLPTVTPQQ